MVESDLGQGFGDPDLGPVVFARWPDAPAAYGDAKAPALGPGHRSGDARTRRPHTARQCRGVCSRWHRTCVASHDGAIRLGNGNALRCRKAADKLSYLSCGECATRDLTQSLSGSVGLFVLPVSLAAAASLEAFVDVHGQDTPRGKRYALLRRRLPLRKRESAAELAVPTPRH